MFVSGLEHLKNVLKMNGYLRKFIDHALIEDISRFATGQ